MTEAEVEIDYRAGNFRVLAQFRDGRWGSFGMGRSDGKLLLVDIPDSLSSEKPVPDR